MPRSTRSVQGLRPFRVLDNLNRSAPGRELFEVWQGVKRNLRWDDALPLDQPVHHPLRGDRRRDAGVDDAPADVPLLVRPCDRLVPQGHRIPVLLADEDAALDVDIEFRLLRLREGINNA